MNKRLSITDQINPNDSIVIYSGNNQDFRGVSLGMLVDEVEKSVELTSQFLIQHFNPNANFTLDIDNNEGGTYLVLNPSAVIAAGTIKLPERYSVVDGQSLLVASAKAITALTINGNNATVIGGPTTLVAGGFFSLKYDKLSNTWYRVG